MAMNDTIKYGLQPMSEEQREELVKVFGGDIVTQAEKELTGKGSAAIAIYCAELEFSSLPEKAKGV